MKKDRGIALVVAIIILFTLMAIAAPFVLSMIYKEKITKNTYQRTRARLGAQTARNHALSLLLRSQASFEKSGQLPPPFNTPYCDTPDEFKIDFTSFDFSRIFQAANPRGNLLGCDVEDEQGKINIKTATPALMQSINGVIAAATKPPEKYLTEYSYNACDWVAPVQLRGYITVALPDGRQVCTIPKGTCVFGGRQIELVKAGTPGPQGAS